MLCKGWCYPKTWTFQLFRRDFNQNSTQKFQFFQTTRASRRIVGQSGTNFTKIGVHCKQIETVTSEIWHLGWKKSFFPIFSSSITSRQKVCRHRNVVTAQLQPCCTDFQNLECSNQYACRYNASKSRNTERMSELRFLNIVIRSDIYKCKMCPPKKEKQH